MPDDDHHLAAAGDRGTEVLHGRSGRKPLVGLRLGAGRFRECFARLSSPEQRAGDDRVGFDAVGLEPLRQLMGLAPALGRQRTQLIRLAGSGLGVANEIEPHAASSIKRTAWRYHRAVLGEVLTASVTPFDADGEVNLPKFRELAAYLVDHGSDGLVVTGTTGESPTLRDEERFALYAAAIDAVGERATIVAGTGTYDTRHSVHLTEKAHELGVDGFLVVTPYYNKPPPRGIVEHVKAIAAVTDKPIVYYNIPARVVNLVSVETLAELAQIPNVVAVKQAWDDLEDARRIVEETGLQLYAGDDALLLPFLELGGTGGVCVHTHVVGPQVKEQIQAFRAGNVDRARELDAELAPAYEILGVTVGPIGIKAALNLLGHDVGGLRLPLVEATEEEREQIRGCLERLGALQAVSA
jgi:4-hydroxy-tetrahydrodipicolinate synthase